MFCNTRFSDLACARQSHGKRPRKTLVAIVPALDVGFQTPSRGLRLAVFLRRADSCFCPPFPNAAGSLSSRVTQITSKVLRVLQLFVSTSVQSRTLRKSMSAVLHSFRLPAALVSPTSASCHMHKEQYTHRPLAADRHCLRIILATGRQSSDGGCPNTPVLVTF